jgi:hypothetical protein
MGFKILLVQDLHFSESPLPYFAFIAELLGQPMQEPALDKLHGLFDGHAIFNRQ